MLTVRPFESEIEYERMIEYFLGGGEAFLLGMGVDPAKLPEREVWLQATLADGARSDAEKERFYLAWLHDSEQIGHSSISHIQLLEVAHVHLHLWRSKLRRNGLGTELLARSLDFYFERFALKTIVSRALRRQSGAPSGADEARVSFPDTLRDCSLQHRIEARGQS